MPIRDNMNKICIRCGIPKPLTEFYKDKSMSDGLYSKCKKCCIDLQRVYRQTESGKNVQRRYILTKSGKESYKRKQKKYFSTDKGKETLLRNYKKFRSSKEGKISHLISNKKWVFSNLEKKKAHRFVELALYFGFIIKLPCEICGNPKSEFHHPDYTNPLDGIWLCHKDHMLIHKILKILKKLGYEYSNEQWSRE